MTSEIIIVLYYLIFIASPTTTQTTAGMYFVVAVPIKLDNRTSQSKPVPLAFLHITSEDEYATLWISTPENPNKETFTTSTQTISKSEYLKLSLKSKSGVLNTGTYWTTFIKSSGHVRIWVEVKVSDFTTSDVFVLIPETSSYQSYYVTTSIGGAFIMVCSFGSPTKINVTFPNHAGQNYKIACASGGKICAPGKTVTILLKKHQVWILASEESAVDFHNTLITSDKRIFVVSGNTLCTEGFDINVADLCVSSMTPTVSWGKTYVVPNNAVINLSLRFNFMTQSINIMFFHSVTTRDKNDQYSYKKTFRNDKHTIYSIKRLEGPLVVASEEHFGLYQFFKSTSGGSTDSNMMSLIPVGQWPHGTFWKHMTFDAQFGQEYNIILSIGEEQSILLLDDSKPIRWQDVGFIHDRKLTQGLVNLKNVKTRIVSTSGAARFLLYIQLHTNRDGNNSKLINFPYDFYQSGINEALQQCTASLPVAGDGVDNDCDGFVDEESLNAKDDDSDGRIDEDVIRIFQDGNWSRWSTKCNLKCNGEPYRVETRGCMGRSRFGKDCIGEGIRCNNGSCPETCSETKKDDSRGCYCGSKGGCETCRHGYFICDSCKPGLIPSKHCASKCPENWSGGGCSKISKTDKGVLAVIQKSMERTLVFGLMIAILAGIVVGTVLFGGRRTGPVEAGSIDDTFRDLSNDELEDLMIALDNQELDTYTDP